MEVEITQEDKSIEVVQQDSSSSSSSKRSRIQCDDVVESNVLSETPNKNEDEKECAAETVTVSIPQKPIKRARTAYFIFADEKRSEVQSKVRWINLGCLENLTTLQDISTHFTQFRECAL
jgi:hypothetical protein